MIFQSTYVDPITFVWAPADRATADLAAAEAALNGLKSDPDRVT
ncbi:MAG: hypothetical protein Q8Q26_02675 [Pseudorhodobacter sp.]|nr:hypothetical protein [Pseudorhodobacter sp.]